MKTSGNTVFISGGSAGIGLAFAKSLVSLGNKVVINGRDEKRLSEALKDLGHNAFSLQGDLSSEQDRIRIANELVEKYPEVNIIINNAGLAKGYLLSNTVNAHENAKEEMNTNYFSIIHFTELMLPHLLKMENAAVVNISSIAVFGSHPYLPTYGASKAALHSYTTALRNTYQEQTNLEVYEVYPPLVNTAFSAEIGGEKGIPASEVADELILALEKYQFEVPVGETKRFFESK